jgi:hypothetical protein
MRSLPCRENRNYKKWRGKNEEVKHVNERKRGGEA